jgi:lipopolysaccharide export system protein LptA
MRSTSLPTARIPAWLLISTLLLGPVAALALESDKDQPIGVEADSVDIDDRKGLSVYKGDVVLTQGSIVIKADKLTVTQSEKKSDHVVAEGRPVTYRQETDDDKGVVTGKGTRIEYDADSETIYLIGDAVLTQGKDSFKSDRITYDRAKSIVRGGASAKGKQRVKVTIGKSDKK